MRATTSIDRSPRRSSGRDTHLPCADRAIPTSWSLRETDLEYLEIVHTAPGDSTLGMLSTTSAMEISPLDEQREPWKPGLRGTQPASHHPYTAPPT
jgi:hypothetical protein